jgi:hypothetical protein
MANMTKGRKSRTLMRKAKKWQVLQKIRAKEKG